MSGTKESGRKAAETNKTRYGKDYYARIGGKGGSRTQANGARPKGFAVNRELARQAGAKAGKISKRNHTFIENKKGFNYYLANDTGRVVKYKHESNS